MAKIEEESRDVTTETEESRDVTTKEESRDVTTENLIAERNSLKDEVEKLMKKLEAREKELKETKELNFTLGRQVARTDTEIDIEKTIHNIFGKGD